eukprot:GDKJ01046846.1.p1 GENE.GDKJ01046846.1~~GDKJ01046846.1.p1  ORF type:complete len:172 (+),score=38.04 GDKJ01046846.1:86-601(+)
MRFFTALLIAAVACIASADDILDVLIKRPETRTIATMVKKEGVDKEIRGYDDGVSKWTFLAITNSAYTSQPRRNLAFLSHPRNREVLRKVLEYHIISGSVTKADLIEAAKRDGFIKTFGGENLPLRIQGSEVIIGKNGKIVTSDLKVDQGIVQIIDSVLYPPNTVPDARRI